MSGNSGGVGSGSGARGGAAHDGPPPSSGSAYRPPPWASNDATSAGDRSAALLHAPLGSRHAVVPFDADVAVGTRRVGRPAASTAMAGSSLRKPAFSFSTSSLLPATH